MRFHYVSGARAMGTTLVLFLLCVAGWWLSRLNASHLLQHSAEASAEQVAARVGDCVNTRLEILSSMAREKQAGGLSTPEDFRARAESLLHSFPGYQAISLVDENGIIVQVNPVQGNQPALGRDLFAHPVASRYLERVQASGQLQITEPLELYQGGRGFAFYVPIQNAAGKPAGFVNGAFRSVDLLHSCLGNRFPEDFFLDFRDLDKPVFASGSVSGEGMARADLDIYNRGWTVFVAPTPQTLTHRGGPGVGALFGWGLLCLFIGGVTYQMLVGRENRRRAERAQQRELLELAAVAESASDFVAMAELDGRLKFLNRAALQTLGLPALPRDMRVPEVFAEDVSEALQHHGDLLQQHGTATTELPVLNRQTGEAIPMLFTTFLVKDPATGEPIGRGTVGRDLREYRRLEHSLQQARRMEALGRLAGGVAHDFNNLLTVVMGSANLLRMCEPEEHDDLLDQLDEATVRAAALIRQLMTLGRNHAGELRALDVGDTLRGMNVLLGRLVPEDRKLEVSIGPDLPPVRAENVMIEQIVLNLVMNAVDASNPGGRIGVDVTRTAGGVSLCVSDEGEGMSPEVVERVFEPFFTTKGVGAGTGLGLATVYSHIKQLGGTIDIESAPGRGTTMGVRLPAAASSQADELPEQPDSTDELEVPPGARILLVEDEAEVRRVAVAMLKRAGFDVEEASNGRMATEKLKVGAYDLVITDAVMPVMGGGELVAWMAERSGDTPVLVVSGHLRREVDRMGPAVRTVRILQKPYTQGQLINAVRRAIGTPVARLARLRR